MTFPSFRPLAAAAALASAATLGAQTEASFTHYTIQPTLVNPALVGFDGEHEGRLNYRAAAAGLPGAPTTYALGYAGAIGPAFGLGAQVFAENAASHHRYGARLAYAFRTRVAGAFKVAGGFATSFSREELRLGSSRDFDYDGGDPELMRALEGSNALDASVGLHARHRDGSFVGVVLPTLVAAYLGEAGTDAERGGPGNFILRAGHEFVIPSRNFRVTPMVAVHRLYGVPFRVDVGATAAFLDERFVAGLAYRGGESADVGVLLGARFGDIGAYYSYDVSFGEFQSYHAGGHELTLGFEFRSRRRFADEARYE